MITLETLVEFERITGKNIKQFFRKALDFFDGDYHLLMAYYTGNTKEIKSDPFVTLQELESLVNIFFAAFHAHGYQLTNLKWWYLLEELENIDNRLRTVRNMNRWARSTRSNVSYNPNTEFNYTIPSGQTLERISQDILRDDNPDDEWADIALRNSLREEDYTTEGGVSVKLPDSSGSSNFQVSAVVDIMQGKSMLGKDLHKSIGFADNDLRCLDYDATVYQSVGILSSLRKNDNPFAPDSGLQSAVVIGANRASLNFPVIIRQMTTTFATDDTLKNFTINEIKVVVDNLLISYQVQTRLNETIDASILI